jgi:hypothetical protein
MAVADGHETEEVIRAAALRWRGEPQPLARRPAGPAAELDESSPAPCVTDKPGWDGYGGALLLAAHDKHPELPPPAVVSADWPDDLACQAASARGPTATRCRRRPAMGLAVLRRLAARSVRSRVPMKLDF